MKNENIKEELKGISKFLVDLPKAERENIPDGYFEKLPEATWDKISSEISDRQRKNTKVIPLLGKLAGIAASVALLVFLLKGIGPSEDEIPVDTMVEYIMNDLSELDEEFLFELHDEVNDIAELDETLDYMVDEEIDMIDDNILETLY